MNFSNAIFCVDSHTAGEPTRVVMGGLPSIPGSTLADKTKYFSSHLDHFRRTLTGEPRGHAPVHSAVVLQSTLPEADFSLIIMSALGYSAMCGHLLIGTVTSLLEMGNYPMKEPCTELAVETLAGLMRIKAEIESGRVKNVTFQNQPSYAAMRDLYLKTGSYGNIWVDISYGGMWYVIVDVDQIGLQIELENVTALKHAGTFIRNAVNNHLNQLPDKTGLPEHIPQLLFTGKPKQKQADGRNFVTSRELGFDRSPCGTGSCAKMALLYARGELGIEQPYLHESIVDTTFTGRIVAETHNGCVSTVIPEITGSAFITGIYQILIDPMDPLKHGFFVTG